MVRKKVKIEYIENENTRKSTYKKRVKGVVKKTEELSVLCGVDACAVIYGPYSQVPVVWPSSEEEVTRIVSAYKRNTDFNQSQRQFNQNSFLKHSVQKAEERLVKLQRRNKELEMENLATNILTGRMTLEQVMACDLGDLLWVLEDKIRSIDRRIRLLEGADPIAGGSVGSTNEGLNNGMTEGVNDVMG